MKRTAMQKFTKWSTEHDSQFAKRQESNRKGKIGGKPGGYRKVTPAPKKESTPANESTSEEE